MDLFDGDVSRQCNGRAATFPAPHDGRFFAAVSGVLQCVHLQETDDGYQETDLRS